jgi:hypothetical protein
MPITLHEGVAHLEGLCPIEDAEALLDMLRQAEMPPVDLSQCEHLHMAVLQTLLALRPPIAAPPSDPLLARLVGPAVAPPKDP